MTGFYSYLESVMPIKRIIISLAVGIVTLLIVLISGLSSGYVRGEVVASRTFSAFCFSGLLSFILMMSCEEYAIFKTKRELESFVDNAPMEDAEYFNRAEYFQEPAQEDAFRPLNFQ